MRAKKVEEESKKKWLQIHAGIEDPIERKKGLELAQLAKNRMQSKISRIVNARVRFYKMI